MFRRKAEDDDEEEEEQVAGYVLEGGRSAAGRPSITGDGRQSSSTTVLPTLYKDSQRVGAREGHDMAHSEGKTIYGKGDEEDHRPQPERVVEEPHAISARLARGMDWIAPKYVHFWTSTTCSRPPATDRLRRFSVVNQDLLIPRPTLPSLVHLRQYPPLYLSRHVSSVRPFIMVGRHGRHRRGVVPVVRGRPRGHRRRGRWTGYLGGFSNILTCLSVVQACSWLASMRLFCRCC